MTKSVCEKLNYASLVAGLWLLGLAAGQAQDRDVLEFHGIQPGISRVKDLKPPVWKSMIADRKSSFGFSVLDYEIEPWKKVSLHAKDGFILGIDLYPSAAYTSAQVGQVFSLGKLKKIASLPGVANFPSDRFTSDILQSESAMVLLEIIGDDDKTVNRIRFYGRPRPKPPASGKTPNRKVNSPKKSVSGFPPPPPLPSELDRKVKKSPPLKQPSTNELESSSKDANNQKSTSSQQTKGERFDDARDTMELHGVVPGKTTRQELKRLSHWKNAKVIDIRSGLDVYEYYDVAPNADERLTQITLSRLLALHRESALSAAETRQLQLERQAIGLDEVEALRFELQPWKKIVLLLQGDIVWVIDAYAPEGATLEQIENAFGLKRPTAQDLKANSARPFLPQGLRVGPTRLPSALQYREYEKQRLATFARRSATADEIDAKNSVVKLVRFFADVPVRHPIFGVVCSTVAAQKQIVVWKIARPLPGSLR